MEKFVLFELHEYMDMYPQKKVITFKGETMEEIVSNASKWAKEISSIYSGGPTRFIRVMAAEEAKKYIDEQISKEYKDWQDDSQEFIDKLNTLYDKCYPENLEEEILN